MVCPECGYAMSAFDTDCPRCHGKGIAGPQSTPAPPVSAPATPTNNNQVNTSDVKPTPPAPSIGGAIGAIIVFIVFVAWPMSCFLNPSRNTSSSSTSTATAPKLYHDIEYRISGNAPAVDLTYSNAQGGTQQVNDAACLNKVVFTARRGAFLYISAQNQGDSGTVTVEIVVDGISMKQSTSSGAYVIAQASGRL